MTTTLTDRNSLVNNIIAQLRDTKVQKDRMRFRRNLERFGEIVAYEISQTFNYEGRVVETPLGEAHIDLSTNDLVITGVLRAGLPLHQGLLNMFDGAGSAFVSTYRKHHASGSFEVNLEYLTTPALDGKTLIIADPMLATGSTAVHTIQALLEYGKPEMIHVVTVIGCNQGIAFLTREYPDVHLWVGSIDDELTAKSYIVPGLGDAGDLCYGEKQLD
ncbi:MAG: uracil phosphoribosyltransferase [Saprospiraceae bacterium]|nr:uracil phosphoribosyltransferase [Saprospiraceae bacterium]